MSDGDRHFVGHARTVMLLTLVSRVSGLVRDAVCSRVFGTSAVWSAFVTAFIVPNLFRRLFGEGALSAAFIPDFARLTRDDPAAAERFATLTVALLLAALGGVVLLLELALLGALAAGLVGEESRRVAVYAMVMLPYVPLVCATAILGGMLQSHGRFVPHAAAPVILNACMAGAAALASLRLGAGPEGSGLAVAGAVVVAGVLQMGWCLWSLRTVMSWRRPAGEAWGRVRAMLGRMGPVLIGMGTLQLGTLIDGLLAGWPVLAGPAASAGYPMDEGSASALYWANRLYQFPLGVFGIAIATAVFPALARCADAPADFAATLRRGLRTSLFIGLPASAGLLLVAEPLTATIYRGGVFDDADVARVRGVLVMYAPAVWAYSLTHVLTRSFYAVGETTLPMRVGIATVALNLALNLALMWTLAERGLALATSLSAVAQCGALTLLASRRLPRPDGSALLDGPTLRGVAWSGGMTLAMVGGVLIGRWALGATGGGWGGVALALGRDVACGGLVYGGVALALRRAELRWLLERPGRSKGSPPGADGPID